MGIIVPVERLITRISLALWERTVYLESLVFILPLNALTALLDRIVRGQ